MVLFVFFFLYVMYFALQRAAVLAVVFFFCPFVFFFLDIDSKVVLSCSSGTHELCRGGLV